MANREPAGSRPSSRSGSSRSGSGPRGAKARSDGKIDISCPQCAAQYRIAEEKLDQKIECPECHRVFFAKTTVGKRAKPPDHSKTYLALGVGSVVLIGIFFMMSRNNNEPAKQPKVEAPKAPVVTRGTHPRALQIVKWAQAISDGNLVMIQTYNDLQALGTALGIADTGDSTGLLAGVAKHETTKYLRDMVADSATLTTDEAMTAATGAALLFVTPKPGTDDYKTNTRGEIEVTFHMAGEQVKVTGWSTKLHPVRNPNKVDPSKILYVPNKDIATPDVVEVSDSAGTRKVKESKPTPVPHWEKATPEQRAKADQVVADVLRSADNDAPGRLFNKATNSVQSVDDKKAVVPRALNAMFELYGDPNGNNMKLSQLDRALRGWTGYAVNYDPAGSGDATKDKAARESCVRQWFAYWWRHSSGELNEFIDTSENLDEPLETDKTDKNKKPAK